MLNCSYTEVLSVAVVVGVIVVVIVFLVVVVVVVVAVFVVVPWLTGEWFVVALFSNMRSSDSHRRF